MQLRPTSHNRHLILCSGVFFVVGVFVTSPYLIFLACAMIGLLGVIYASLRCVALELSSKKVSISWKAVHRHDVAVGSTLRIELEINNQSARPIRVHNLAIHGSKHIHTSPQNTRATIPPHSTWSSTIPCHSMPPGYHVIHGFKLSLEDFFGLFNTQAYFAKSTGLWCPLESSIQTHRPPWLRPTFPSSAIAPRGKTAPSKDGNLSKIRTFQSGDPFKNIAWKKTAQHQKLMVQENENHFSKTILYVWQKPHDAIANTLSSQALKSTLRGLSSQIQGALKQGHQVGILIQDQGSEFLTPPSSKANQQKRLMSFLRDALRPPPPANVIETDLYEKIAHHIKKQRSIDLRSITPKKPHKTLKRAIVPGPSGQFYDRNHLLELLNTHFKLEIKSGLSRFPKRWTPSQEKWDTFDLKSKSVFYANAEGVDLPGAKEQQGVNTQAFKLRIDALTQTLRLTDVVYVLDPMDFLTNTTGIRSTARSKHTTTTYAFPMPMRPKHNNETDAPASANVEQQTLGMALKKAKEWKCDITTF